MPPKTTTKAAADKPADKPIETPVVEGLPIDMADTTGVVTPPPEGSLEAAAAALAAEASAATVPTPPVVVGVDPAAPGGDSTVLADIELEPTEGAPKIRVRALLPIKHDGVLYGPASPAGDTLTVSPAERDALAVIGAIEDPLR